MIRSAAIGTRRRLAYFIAAAALPLALTCEAPLQAEEQAATKAAPQAAQLPDHMAFAKIPFVDDVEISPDGTRIAGLFGIGGRQVIGLYSLVDPNEKKVLVGLPDDTQADWVRWVNDDNILVGVSALQPVIDGERWYITRLISVNRNTSKITRLLWDSQGQNASDVLWVATDGSPQILVAAQLSIFTNELFWPIVWRVDVEKGSKKRELSGQEGVMNWDADSTGRIRAGTGYRDENRTFRLLYRGEKEGGFRTADRADTRKGEGLLNPFMFLPEGDQAMAIHTDDGGREGIYKIDMRSLSDVEAVFSAPTGSEILSVMVSDDRSSLLGVRTSSTETPVRWFDPTIADVQSALDQSVPGRKVNIISFSRNRQRMLVNISRPDNPGALYFFDINDNRLQRIAFYNDAIGNRTLSPVRAVRYKARDGLEIEAILTVPKGRAEKNLPIIMMPHGGPWAHDTLTYDYWAQFLASQGYVVMQPNFRGSTGYGAEFTAAGEGQMGLAMQDDITDGLKWAVEQGIADPKRACIVGASYGGYAAMWGIIKDPDLYRCAISIAGVASLRREVSDFGDSLRGGLYKDQWKRMTPDFPAVSPINGIDRIKAPLMLIHGRRDVTVDVVQSRRMNARMETAGKAVEYVELPEADHYFTKQADREVLLSSMATFLAKNNPAD